MAYLRAHDDLYYGKILELRQVVAPAIAYQRTRYAEWGTDRDKPKPEPVSSEDLPWERYLVGTPSEVIEGLVGLDQEAPLENMRLFAAEVAPRVREAVETA